MVKQLNKESLVAIELSRLDEKIKEFQDYLEKNTIITKINRNNELKKADEENRHKEIDTQIKMINALFVWLPALEKLRGTDKKGFDARGGTEVNGMFAASKD